MNILDEAKSHITESQIEDVMDSENSIEFDVGYYKGIFDFIKQMKETQGEYAVDDLLAKGIFNYDDIKNGTMSDEDILFEWEDDIERMKSENPDMTEADCIDIVRMEEDTHHEIFEWYLISDWFEERLIEINEPILYTDYWNCLYWGRCCTGQAIYLDRNIQDLAYKHSTDERLFKVDEDKLERISRHDRTRP